MRYNRFLPLLIPLLTFILTEIYRYWPKLVFVVSAMALLLFFFALTQFVRASKLDESWRDYILLPSYFFIGIVVFSVMIPAPAVVHALFVFNGVFLYFYFRAVYYRLLNPHAYRANSLEDLSSYGNFLAFYFITSAVFGLQAVLDLPVWSLMLLLVLTTALVVYETLWANGLSNRQCYFYIPVVCLVIIELAWPISFLPLSFYILGLVMSICYYILIGILRLHLLDKLSAKAVKLYLSLGFLSIIAVLFTARWL